MELIRIQGHIVECVFHFIRLTGEQHNINDFEAFFVNALCCWDTQSAATKYEKPCASDNTCVNNLVNAKQFSIRRLENKIKTLF